MRGGIKPASILRLQPFCLAHALQCEATSTIEVRPLAAAAPAGPLPLDPRAETSKEVRVAPAVQNQKRGEVVAAYVRPETATKLREIAATEQRSVSQIVRFALEAGLRDRP